MPETTPESIAFATWAGNGTLNGLLNSSEVFTGGPEDETEATPYVVIEPVVEENHLDGTAGAHVDKAELIFELHVGNNWALGRDLAKALFDAFHMEDFEGSDILLTDCRHRTTGKVKIDSKWIWRVVFEIKIQS